MFCSECKDPCREVRRNFGHGLTEFWGALSADDNYRWVSHCCDAEVVEKLEEVEE